MWYGFNQWQLYLCIVGRIPEWNNSQRRQSCNWMSVDSEGRGYGQDSVYCYQILSIWKTLILIVKAAKVGRAWACGPATASDNSGRMSAKNLQAKQNKTKNLFLLSLWLLGIALLHDCKLSLGDIRVSQARMMVGQAMKIYKVIVGRKLLST